MNAALSEGCFVGEASGAGGAGGGGMESLLESELGPNSCFCIDNLVATPRGLQVVTVSDTVNPAGVPADCVSEGNPSLSVNACAINLLDCEDDGVNKIVASVPSFSACS